MRQYSRLTSTQSKKFELSQKKRAYIVLYLTLFNLFIILFVASKMTSIDFLQINEVAVDGVSSDVSDRIQVEIKEIMSGKYLGLFSKSNLFLYPKGQLLASISGIAPEIQSISINRNGFHNLKINIQTKKTSAVVCASLPDETVDLTASSSNCYLSDWSGLIFKKALAVENDTNLYYSPALTSDAIGSYATSTEIFVALQKFYNSCRDFGLEPEFVLIKDNGEYEMYAKDTVIYFNDDSSLDDQFSNLVSFWDHAKKEKPDVKFEYIKLQYSPNIFYIEK